jgi:general stress protein 26
MIVLTEEICSFLHRQGFVIVSTIDKNGSIHNSCKGIVRIEKIGRIYLMDLYIHRTFRNLRRNQNISITAVDEHGFAGYCLKGKARILKEKELEPGIIRDWEEKITSRITQRLIKNIKGEKGHPSHPEASLPKPKYVIRIEVQKVIDLIPASFK